jgi:hypothetical protein
MYEHQHPSNSNFDALSTGTYSTLQHSIQITLTLFDF